MTTLARCCLIYALFKSTVGHKALILQLDRFLHISLEVSGSRWSVWALFGRPDGFGSSDFDRIVDV